MLTIWFMTGWTKPSFLHQFKKCWSKCAGAEKLKTAVICLIVAHCANLVQNLIRVKMRQQPLNPKVGLLRSISLNLHSNILERVSVFLRELATPLLLVRHWSSSLGVGESSCLGVWSRVGFLWSSNASCPACREDCETKRKDVVIFRMGARYYLVRRMRPLKGRLFLLHTTQGLIF